MKINSNVKLLGIFLAASALASICIKHTTKHIKNFIEESTPDYIKNKYNSDFEDAMSIKSKVDSAYWKGFFDGKQQVYDSINANINKHLE